MFVPLLVLLVVLALLWGVATSNRLIRLSEMIRESWADVDVTLRRRYDLIPNLVEVVGDYAAHEHQTLLLLVQARDAAYELQSTIANQARAERELVRCLGDVITLVESYPMLHSSEQFLALQHELINTEDRIAAARRFYNANVRDYNQLLEQFPSRLLAGGRQLAEFFEIEELAMRSAPVISLATT